MEICDCFLFCLFISVLSLVNQLLLSGGRRGRDHMEWNYLYDQCILPLTFFEFESCLRQL